MKIESGGEYCGQYLGPDVGNEEVLWRGFLLICEVQLLKAA